MREPRVPLHLVREPAPLERKVIHISGIRSHGPALASRLGRPWPSQHAWRDLVLSLQPASREPK
jgi:hypothetical protein